ncbi:TRAP transporter substrate-binding protein DctP [Nocardiopsis coralliicola]
MQMVTVLRRALASAAAVLLAAGCVGHPPDPAAVPEPVRAAGGTVLRLSHVYDPAHPAHTCGVEPVRERLADHGIDLQAFPSAQLGNEEQALQLLRTGSLDMTIAGPAFFGTWYPPAAVFDSAYAFRDVAHFDAVTNGPIGAQVWEGLREEAGLRVPASWYYGTRHTTASHPVRGPGDLAGSKIRVPSAPVYLSNTEVMSGTATPMALGEAYLGLQQGVIDAQENPIPTIRTMRFDEVQSYVSLTGHIVQGVMPVIAEPAYQRLAPGQQEALDAAFTAAVPEVQDCITEQEESILADWRAADSPEVVEDVDTAAFAAKARAELPVLHPEWNGLYERIQDEAAE